VRYFIREVLPLIHAQRPDVALVILGGDVPADLTRLRSTLVSFVGYVEDPSPYFHRARVFVAPLRAGAGMKGKIGQSLSFGLPVVTTPIGAEGMDLVDGRHARVADGREDFAKAVLQLLSDDSIWRRLSVEGQALVTERWSEEAARRRLANLFPFPDGTGR
jgi:glycosyltransferase involved in cell wall biosynthesis